MYRISLLIKKALKLLCLNKLLDKWFVLFAEAFYELVFVKPVLEIGIAQLLLINECSITFKDANKDS
jgi:hypothetical protein